MVGLQVLRDTKYLSVQIRGGECSYGEFILIVIEMKEYI